MKIVTHFKNNAYRYSITVMSILCLHSLVMLGIHGDLSWFGLFVLESGFLVMILVAMESEQKDNESN